MNLRDWLEAQDMTQSAFAAAMTAAGSPMTQSRVSQIVKGGTEALGMALAIERFTDGKVSVAELHSSKAVA